MQKRLPPPRLHKRLILCLVLIFAALNPAALVEAQTVNGRIYLEPASQSVTSGQNITLNIRVNSGGQLIKSATARLTYSTSHFDFVSISASGSAFPDSITASGGSGNITVGRSDPDDVIGSSLLLASVTLKSKSSGTTNISPQSNSTIINEDSNNIYSQGMSAGAAITINSPSSPPPVTPPPSSPPTVSSPRSGSSPGPGSPLKLPTASNNSLPITNPTNRATPTEPTNPSTTSPNLYSVYILIKDSQDMPLSGVTVNVFGVSATTLEEGVVVFDEISPGSYAVQIGDASEGQIDTIEVIDNPDMATQTFTLRPEQAIGATDKNGSPAKAVFTILGGLILGVGAGAALYIWWLRRRNTEKAPIRQPTTPLTPVTESSYSPSAVIPIQNPVAIPLRKAKPQEPEELELAAVKAMAPLTPAVPALEQAPSIVPTPSIAEKAATQISSARAAIEKVAVPRSTRPTPKAQPKTKATPGEFQGEMHIHHDAAG